MKNTEDAVIVMEQNAVLIKAGMESIHKADESAAFITASNQEMVDQIKEMVDQIKGLSARLNEVLQGE